MTKFLTIYQAAEHLGVSPQTLRRWERQGKGIPCHKTAGGQRRYDLALLVDQKDLQTKPAVTLAYARVSSHDQKKIYIDKKKCLKCFALPEVGHLKSFLI